MAWESFEDCPYLRLWEAYEITSEELREYCRECPYRHKCPYSMCR